MSTFYETSEEEETRFTHETKTNPATVPFTHDGDPFVYAAENSCNTVGDNNRASFINYKWPVRAAVGARVLMRCFCVRSWRTAPLLGSSCRARLSGYLDFG